MMHISNNTFDIVWLSVDPVNKRVDFYPKIFAQKLEEAFTKYEIQRADNYFSCSLGPDFFNATVHFNKGSFYQTTPGLSLGRAGFKQPGYRSVKRVIVPVDRKIKILCKFIHEELRITQDNLDYDKEFNIDLPEENIIKSNLVITPLCVITWKPEHLDEALNLDTNVIVWQWCRGVPEKQGNLMKLSDKWWIPYLHEQNNHIETAFSNNEENTTITLPINNSVKTINFIEHSIYAKQNDPINKTQRLIRRKVLTIQELVELISNQSKLRVDVSLLTTLISNDEIPHEFFCCISQEIMQDPVKTSDGFMYDRQSIERWFQTSDKSPLTGLNLIDKTLTPNTELNEQIENFTKLQIEHKKKKK
jgi:hypothetical protein